MSFRRRGYFFIAPAILLFAGCQPPVAPTKTAPRAQKAKVAPADVRFTDVTRAAGINFRHQNGSSGRKYFLEEMGSGCAFLDYDGDGWQDILLLNSAPLPGAPQTPTFPALYRNKGDGTFNDVTAKAGLRRQMYATGVAVGDYDNDGDDDIYVGCWGTNHLFRNDGGKFTDVTALSRTGDKRFAASSCWVDYDNDGWLDLFVCNYLKWDVAHDKKCGPPNRRTYCSPEVYEADANCLYHNNRDGTFSDVTKAMGVEGADGKSLGVTLLDYDGDGWMDIFVANDGTPNFLFHNEQGKRFSNVALEAGVAFPESGTPKAGMGTDAADFDHSGRPSLIIGNFHREGITLSANKGEGFFEDSSARAGVHHPSLNYLTFGLFFFDYDLDGFKDIFAANGHIIDTVQENYPNVTYYQRPLAFFNRGDGTFVETGTKLGFKDAFLARSACAGDFDNDGDSDILLSTVNGSPHLFRNDGGNRRHWLKIQAVGSRANRSAIGTKVEIESDGVKQVDWVRSGSSYCAESDRRLCFGLDKAAIATRVALTFPGGRAVELKNIAANQLLVINEEKGLVSAGRLP